MRIVLAVLVAAVAIVATGGASAGEPVGVVAFDAARAHVYGTGGAPLLGGANGASAVALTKAFLREKGVSAATVDSLHEVGSSAAHGVTHVRLEQEVGGLRVAGAYVRAAVNGRGDLVHVI